ncbi:MAG: PucR family transcriptional regulator [Firmicutes bacterium]|nr:PucR family transcriptional regulator [Bacillota bacterium]
MSVTVSRILSLPSFKDATVLTSTKHLDNTIKQVSISDSPLTEVDFSLSGEGDFYLTEFYFAKDSTEKMIEYLEPMIRSGSSGICIIDEYIKELPTEVLDYCDEHSLPIILNSYTVPYAQMIREIMELIIADGQKALLEKEISAITADTIDESGKIEIIRNMNPYFKNNYAVFYIFSANARTESAISDLFSRDSLCSGVAYKGGILGFISSASLSELPSKVNYYTEQLKSYDDVLAVGISDSTSTLHTLTKTINQAIFSANAALKRSSGGHIVKYSELGIMKLLLLLADSAELEEFYEEIILSITNYDKETNSQLYETMLAFRHCNYQYRETANSLYIHENTVRYRISKVKEIIEAKAPNDDFREVFSLAIKCNEVLNITDM